MRTFFHRQFFSNDSWAMSSHVTDHASESIYRALAGIRLVDPHSHINPHDPASHTLADLLGYHYYTELAHSSGMPKAHIEDRSIGSRELVSRLVGALPSIENTAQYRWLIELCRTFYGFEGDRIDASNWEALYDSAETRMQSADWPQMVLDQSNVEAVFLTNDFDDKLAGFDTDVYVPCLRTDELVFHLHKRAVQQRLEASTGVELDGTLASLREALRRRFEHFVSRGARACAISLPPGFTPTQVSDGRAASALDDVLSRTEQADVANRDALARRVFWTLAELCDEFGLPFDLMIGVNRGVYAEGVYQGQDLYDSRVSLIQYRELFNAFPAVKFPVSVLASVTNQELVSYAWIFPNVITNGHWWYSNTPSFIHRDAAVRLEAVPQTKQIAYYSDAYKLEFIWPKFDMYRRILADLLADNFVRRDGWSEERAIDLGRKILRDNVDEIFPRPDTSKIRPVASDADAVGTVATTAVPENIVTASSGIASTGLAAVTAGDVFADDAFDEDAVAGDARAKEFEDVELLDDAPGDDVSEFDDAEDFGDLDLTVDESDSFETVIESEIDDMEETRVIGANDETLAGDTDYFSELDAIPSDDEIRSLPVADVQLRDLATERADFDVDRLANELDDEPLDIGNLFNDDAAPEIRMLRGEDSFSPDEDSLQMTSNPTTGELVFPIPGDTDSGDTDSSGSEAADSDMSGAGARDPNETLDGEDWATKLRDLQNDASSSKTDDDAH